MQSNRQQVFRQLLYRFLILIAATLTLSLAHNAFGDSLGQASIPTGALTNTGSGNDQLSAPWAQSFPEATYAESFKALFVLFVLATLLESGLAIIFNWRPFIAAFDSRGMKTIISVIFSYVFVSVFNRDIITWLVNVYSETNLPNSIPGSVLTALILSGGSSGINNILVAIGFRSVKTPEQAGLKPQPTEAWISVSLNRKDAIGPVTVLIGPKNGGSFPAAGTILGTQHPPRWLAFFLQDPSRFPTSGGFALKPDATAYTIKLSGRSTAGTILLSAEWGPYLLQPGAMVDIAIDL